MKSSGADDGPELVIGMLSGGRFGGGPAFIWPRLLAIGGGEGRIMGLVCGTRGREVGIP